MRRCLITLMLLTLLFFIVEYGVARCLCATRVFDVCVSSSPLGYLCAKFRFCDLHCWGIPRRKIAYSIIELLTQSLSQLIWCSGNRSACALEYYMTAGKHLHYWINKSNGCFLTSNKVFDVEVYVNRLINTCAKQLIFLRWWFCRWLWKVFKRFSWNLIGLWTIVTRRTLSILILLKMATCNHYAFLLYVYV